MAITTRALISEAAREGTWTPVGAPEWHDDYRRGSERVAVAYNRRGAIVTAAINGTIVTGTAKRSEVIAALRADSTDPGGLAIQIDAAVAKAAARLDQFGPAATSTRHAQLRQQVLIAALAVLTERAA